MGFVTYTTKTLIGATEPVEVITGYVGEIGEILDLSGEKGRYIDDNAFSDRDMQTVILPSNLVSLGFSAFRNCKRLSKVVFSQGLLKISPHAFSNCKELKKLVLPEGIESIDDYAFAYCGLEEIVFPKTLSRIEDNAFCDCKNLPTTLFLPQNITYVGRDIFDRSDYPIKKVIIPDTLLDIQRESFPANCEIVRVPYDGYDEAVKYLLEEDAAEKKRLAEEAAKKEKEQQEKKKADAEKRKKREEEKKKAKEVSVLQYETKSNGKVLVKALDQRIKSVTVPEGVVEIGYGAFQGCELLEKIQLPHTLKRIGSDAFADCRSLRSITIPSSVEQIGRCAFALSGLNTVTIENGIREIGPGAFQGTEIFSIELPDSVETLCTYSFGLCRQLRNVVFGKSLKSISSSAFVETPNLAWGSIVFKDPTGWKLNKFSLIPKNWDTIFADPQKAATAVYNHCANYKKNEAFTKK